MDFNKVTWYSWALWIVFLFWFVGSLFRMRQINAQLIYWVNQNERKQELNAFLTERVAALQIKSIHSARSGTLPR